MISNIYAGNNETAIGLGQEAIVGMNQTKTDKVLRQEEISSKIHLAIREMPKRNQGPAGAAASKEMPANYSCLIPSMSSRIGVAICSLRRELQASA